jgi:peptide/nickel transport system substrate-binding protein
MRGEIDALYEVGRDAIEFVEEESSVAVYPFPRAFVLAFGFNQRHPALGNPAVRRAINLAIDREGIVRERLRGHGLVADGFMWPYHWAIDKTVPAYGFDPDRARKLLDDAGFTVKATASGPVRFSIKCLIPAGIAEFERLGLVVQKNLYDVGIDLQLEPLSTLDLTQKLSAGTFETFLFEMANARTLSWPYRFLHSPQEGQPVYIRWSYTSADAALDRIRYATTDDEIRAGVSALQRILYDDPPAAFISWGERTRAVSRRFAVPDRPGYDVFTSTMLWQWKPASAVPE